MEMNFKQYFMESSTTRVRRMMIGDVEDVNSVGLMTAQNPSGQDLNIHPEGRKENNLLNRQLERDVKSLGLGFTRIGGVYGGAKEKSYLIPNISRDQLIELGRKYGQEAVIWGSKKISKFNYPYMEFQWIEDGNTTQTRDIHADASDRDDFYSQHRSGKFAIPFFDDPMSKWSLGDKYGTLKRPDDNIVKIPKPGDLRKAESFNRTLF